MTKKPNSKRSKSLASQRLLRVFWLPGGRDKSASGNSVKFVDPSPEQANAQLLAQRHLAVTEFLASDRRVSINTLSNDGAPAGGISRSNTCPNLNNLSAGRSKEVPLAARRKKVARLSNGLQIKLPARPSSVIVTSENAKQVTATSKPTTAPSTPGLNLPARPEKELPEPEKPEAEARPKSRGSKSVAQVPTWNLFRAQWSFYPNKSSATEDKKESRQSRSLILEPTEGARPFSMFESLSLPAPGLTPTQGSFPIPSTSAPRSRHHSRTGSYGSWIHTPDSTSPSSGGMVGSLSSLTAQTSLSSTGTRLEAVEMNLNRRYEAVPDNKVPAWYIKDVDSRNSSTGGSPKVEEGQTQLTMLCANCKRVDMDSLFRQAVAHTVPPPRDFIVMGTLFSLMTRKHCGLCQLAARVIANDAMHGLGRTQSQYDDTDEDEPPMDHASAVVSLLEETYYLAPCCLRAPGRSPELYFFSSKDIKQGTWPRRTMAIRPMETSSGSDGGDGGTNNKKNNNNNNNNDNNNTNQPAGVKYGRFLRAPGEMDFDWIRDRLRDCEDCDGPNNGVNSTILPKRDAQTTVRAVDVLQMCVVNLSDYDSYVALSYVPDEQAEMPLLLHRVNEASLRHPKGLLNCWDQVPRTVQDAVKLVREIGERYLWVDALCVMHDDDGREVENVRETGRIFQDSVLTICACCGADASHGIPGVEPGSRLHTRQVVEMVGGNMLGSVFRGARCEDYGAEQSQWGSRAWTLQEQVLSRRRLLVTDECVTWCCSHGQIVEDEAGRSCCDNSADLTPSIHLLDRLALEPKIDDTDTAIVSKQASNMDAYARIVSEYTRRELHDVRNAERAVAGLLNHLEPAFKGQFLFGLPDTELAAALMWSPIGPTTRRTDPSTNKPLFPSWSWLGWTGQASYPWLVERTMPMSEEPGSPLLWQNLAVNIGDPHDEWFTGDDYRLNGLPHANHVQMTQGLPARWCEHEDDGWTHVDGHDGTVDDAARGGRWLHPVLEAPENGRVHRLLREGDTQGLLRFHTLSAKFALERKVRVRKRDTIGQGGGGAGAAAGVDQTVHMVRVLNKRGFASGYIYWPADKPLPSNRNSCYGQAAEKVTHEFVVISRASARSDPRIGQELLHATPLGELSKVYSMDYYLVGGGRHHHRLRPTMGDGGEGSREDGMGGPIIDEMAQFDTRLYDPSTPWGLFNVMMIQWRNGEGGQVAERVAVGRIHVAAFMDAWPVDKNIVLG
ncbi:uncharacterized protein PgNI_02539 [Pyricularia grisea]|uniref:Heterokaryon incompatibility domain-containing protein n=1 Tax=Pyricularia grisea TaxID=148305 RepID=A0A6P8BFD7_PYRGI|nr:uncharacterized protein PgNI_02539 [Pyricularia grisea]TLD15541.1 hypothetical protein PgNI_02539 [Pyricularia grisea]